MIQEPERPAGVPARRRRQRLAVVKCLRMRVVDRSVLALIQAWLSATVVEIDDRGRSQVTRPTQGTPQGGEISPLLANIYLHWFEQAFYGPQGPAA